MLSTPIQDEVLTDAAGSHFQIGRHLGSGGYSQVFQAWDAQLRRHVAIKRLHSPMLPQGPQLLLTEARLAASLKHAAFVRIFSIAPNEQALSIVMELIEGSTLAQRAGTGALPLQDVLDIVHQVAEAMQEAHQTQLVHGDLKPSNLMLDGAGRVRILDFGLARIIDPLTTATGLPEDTQGTIAYMAPERLLGQPSSPASDIYALGVILYELIAGHRPHAELHGLALAAAHVQSPSTQWDYNAFNPACATLVRAMTTQQPAHRLISMQLVCERIRAAAAHPASTLVSLPPAMEVLEGDRQSPRQAHRLLRWACAGALCLLALTGLAWQLTPGLLARFAPALSEMDALRAGMDKLATADRQDSPTKAIGYFNAVLEKNPRHAAAAAGLSLAYSLRYAGDGRDEAWLKLADASAQQALSLDNQLALAHAAQAAVREYQGRYQPALEASARALRLDPLNTIALLGRCRLMIAMHRYPDAEQALGEAMRQHPRERRFADLIGTLHYRQGNYAQAERDFRLSLTLEPNAVYAYANLSAALLSQDRGDEALQVLQRGLAIRPDSHLYTNLGTTLYARGSYAEAASAFEQATSAAKGNPNNYLVWANLADALRWLPGRQQDARAAYLHASELLAPLLQRSPDNINRMSRMGLYQARLGLHPAGLLWSQRAIDAAPASPEVQFRAAIAAELAGRRDIAITRLARARALGYAANLIESEPDLISLRRAAPSPLPSSGNTP